MADMLNDCLSFDIPFSQDQESSVQDYRHCTRTTDPPFQDKSPEYRSYCL